jgi:hypothetical protein
VGRAIELRKTQNQDADSFLVEEGNMTASQYIASEQLVLRSLRTRAR